MFEQFISSFAGGEVSEEIFGQYPSDLYKNALQRCENFFSLLTGPAQYRGGFSFVHPTRQNLVARQERFKFNDQQVYILEFTNGKLRIYEDAGLTLSTTAKAITGATQANPGVLTVVGHGYSTG